MNRIVVSPKACAVAALVIGLYNNTGHAPLWFNDRELADTLGLEADTVYRALVELDQLGAVVVWRVDRSAGLRRVSVVEGHWLYAALGQGLAESGVA